MDNRLKPGISVTVKRWMNTKNWDRDAKKVCGKTVKIMAISETGEGFFIDKDDGKYIWREYQVNMHSIRGANS